MSKNHHRRKFTCIGNMEQTTGSLTSATRIAQYSPEMIAKHAKRAMDHLAPLIRNEAISPVPAILLAALLMIDNINGHGKQSATNEELRRIVNSILAAWSKGILKPCSKYPYTLEQTLEAIDIAESEDE